MCVCLRVLVSVSLCVCFWMCMYIYCVCVCMYASLRVSESTCLWVNVSVSECLCGPNRIKCLFLVGLYSLVQSNTLAYCSHLLLRKWVLWIRPLSYSVTAILKSWQYYFQNTFFWPKLSATCLKRFNNVNKVRLS